MATPLKFPIGIEIETKDNLRGSIYEFDKELPSNWTRGVDHSNLEFRSNKMTTEEELFISTEKICKALAKYNFRLDPRCGIHIHVGYKHITDLTAKYRLFRFFSCYENVIWKLHSPLETRQMWCKKLMPEHWKSVQSGQAFNAWKDPHNNYSAPGDSQRFWWFNGEAWFKFGTIEFRLMNASHSHEDILNWVSLLQCIFHATTFGELKMQWQDPAHSTPAQMLKDLKDHANNPSLKYLYKRAVQFVKNYPNAN